MQDVSRYIEENRDRFLSELFLLLRRPSISTQNQGVTECAHLLQKQMRAIGIPAQVLPTARHPIVLGERRSPAATKTVPIYGHYDVQPPEPLELWNSPPFEPTVREGRIYGRGTGENKGQLFAHLKAVEAVLRVKKRLPVNVTFLFEGEEEIGSRNPPGVHRGQPGAPCGGLGLLLGRPDAAQRSAHHPLRRPRRSADRGLADRGEP